MSLIWWHGKCVIFLSQLRFFCFALCYFIGSPSILRSKYVYASCDYLSAYLLDCEMRLRLGEFNEFAKVLSKHSIVKVKFFSPFSLFSSRDAINKINNPEVKQLLPSSDAMINLRIRSSSHYLHQAYRHGVYIERIIVESISPQLDSLFSGGKSTKNREGKVFFLQLCKRSVRNYENEMTCQKN